MGEKHYVVVDQRAERVYLERGYARASLPLEAHLGTFAWNLMPEEDRRGLVLLEIGKAEHETKQRLPRKFMLSWRPEAYAGSPTVAAYDVMETDEFDSWVANSTMDVRPECVGNDRLFPTARDAVAANKEHIEHDIAVHRAAALALEGFLKRYECL